MVMEVVEVMVCGVLAGSCRYGLTRIVGLLAGVRTITWFGLEPSA